MANVLNPYHFVPTFGGQRLDDLPKAEFDAGASPHVRHDRYAPGTFSGRIVCRLITETPLVVGAAQRRDPASEPAVVAPYMEDGEPAIPASSLKGMLSGIIEAATNSSLRVLEDRALTYRKPMDKALSAVGLVEARTAGGREEYWLQPLAMPVLKKDGNRAILPPKFRPLFPAPRFKVLTTKVTGYPSFRPDRPQFWSLPIPVIAWAAGTPGEIDLVALTPEERQSLKIDGQGFGVLGQVTGAAPASLGSTAAAAGLSTVGILRTIGAPDRFLPKSRHYELFLSWPPEAPVRIPDPVVERFHRLADERSEDTDGGAPYEPVGTPRNTTGDQAFLLKSGDMVYFDVDPHSVVNEISLSAIWRGEAGSVFEFFRAVDPELLPFTDSRNVITLAEQILGFVEDGRAVNRASSRALAGRLRIGSARFQGESRPGLPWAGQSALDPNLTLLRILSSPKPPSPSLYFRRRTGPPSHIPKTELSSANHLPQGRKFYLHHRPVQAGQSPWKTRHSNDSRNQKALVRLVRDGAEFWFHVDFANLSGTELGAVLYALRPTADFRHKLGMGRSIGLGSVRIEPIGAFLVDRAARYQAEGLWSPRYSSVWKPNEGASAAWPGRYAVEGLAAASLAPDWYDQFRSGFRDRMVGDIRFALEWLGLRAHGQTDVRPPMLNDHADPEQDTYEWFVQNERGAAPNGHQTLEPLSEKPAMHRPVGQPRFTVHDIE